MDISEGLLDADTMGGRHWAVDVRPVGDVRADAKREKENRRAAELERIEGERLERMVSALRAAPEGDSQRQLGVSAGLNTSNAAKALHSLLRDGRVERCQVQKHGRGWDGWRLKK